MPFCMPYAENLKNSAIYAGFKTAYTFIFVCRLYAAVCRRMPPCAEFTIKQE
jgi:hypothetical protein